MVGGVERWRRRAGTVKGKAWRGPPEADPRRIAVMALSFRGYHAPRAAAFEHRFAACQMVHTLWSHQEFADAPFVLPHYFGRRNQHQLLFAQRFHVKAGRYLREPLHHVTR